MRYCFVRTLLGLAHNKCKRCANFFRLFLGFFELDFLEYEKSQKREKGLKGLAFLENTEFSQR